MNGNPKDSKDGYLCPVKNCKKRETTLYSITGLVAHLQSAHKGFIQKKLKLQKAFKNNRKIEILDSNI